MLANSFSIVFFISFVLACLLFTYSIGKGFNHRNRVFFFITISIAIWAVTFSFMMISRTEAEVRLWHRLSSLGWCSIYALILHFSILTRYGKIGKRPWLKLFLMYLPVAVLIYSFGINTEIELAQYSYVMDKYGWITYSKPNILKKLFILYYSSFSIMTLYNFIMWGRSSDDLGNKKASKLLAGSLLISILLGSITDMVLNQFLDDKIPSMAPIFVMLPIFSFYYSIRRYKLITAMEQYEYEENSILTVKSSIAFTRYMVVVVFLTGVLAYYNALLFPELRLKSFIVAVALVIYSMHILNLMNLRVSMKKKEKILITMVSLFVISIVPICSFIGINNGSWAIPMLIIIPSSIVAGNRLFYLSILTVIVAEILYITLNYGTIITVQLHDYIARIIIVSLAIYATYLVSKSWQEKRATNDRNVEFHYLLSYITYQFAFDNYLNVPISVERSLEKIKEFYNAKECYLESYDNMGEVEYRIVLDDNRDVMDSQLEIIERLLMSCIKQAEDNSHIDSLLKYDQCTQVYTRAYFIKFFSEYFKKAEDENKYFSLMIIDIDSFKEINDILGYDNGNDVLKIIADVFVRLVKDNGHIFRFDGDEFLIVTELLSSSEDLEKLTNKLVGELINIRNNPLLYNNTQVFTTLSIGVAFYPENASDGEILVKNAEMAMFNAKLRGKNQACYYEDEMREDTANKLKITSALQSSITRGEISLRYQPQVDVRDGRIIGFEALVRWNSPELGFVSPGVFIPLAEQSKFINELGEFVLHEACKQLSIWRKDFGKDYRMAINLSPRQLYNKGIEDRISNIIKEYSLNPENIDLEITEGMMIRDFKFFSEKLEAIRKIGVEVSIDDYGTEYSSMMRLKGLSVDRLKIDMHFVRGIGKSHMDDAVVKSLIHLGKGFGLKVLAEGVEEEYQLQFLRENGCDEYQGYYKNKPLTVDEVDQLYH